MKNDMETYRMIFSTINSSKSGHISPKELHEVLNNLGVELDLEVVKQMIVLVDRDYDGELNIDEFIHFLYICDNGVPNDFKSILFLATDD